MKITAIRLDRMRLPLFTGRDPLSIADHVKTIESIGFHAGRYWPLEAALWDVAGQVTGQPVSVLFGGASRRLPAYASFGEARSPQARAQAAAAAKAAGFRAMKIRISRTEPASSLEAVRATRAAVGDDIAIMADLNQWWRMAGDVSPALDETQVRAGPDRRRRLPDRPRRPRPRRRNRPRRRGPLHPVQWSMNPPQPQEPLCQHLTGL